MKRWLFVALMVFTLIAAVGCAVGAGSGTPEPDRPVSSDEPQPQPQRDEDEGVVYQYGVAAVDEIDIRLVESFPVQVNVAARGNLPDGCTEIDEAQVRREGNLFRVTLTTRRPADQMCTEALVPYEYVFPLDVEGLRAGEYTVDVNGVVGTFTLEIDNVLPEEGSTGGGQTLYDLAHVTDVEAHVSGAAPARVEIAIRGYLPDACTEISSISDRLEGGVIRVTVETRRPADLICAQVIEDFEVRYTLTSILGRGAYIVDVNGTAQTQVTVP